MKREARPKLNQNPDTKAERQRVVMAKLGPVHGSVFAEVREACEESNLTITVEEWSVRRRELGWAAADLAKTPPTEPVPVKTSAEDELKKIGETLARGVDFEVIDEEEETVPEPQENRPSRSPKKDTARDALHRAVDKINEAIKELTPVIVGELVNEDERETRTDCHDACTAVRDLTRIKHNMIYMI